MSGDWYYQISPRYVITGASIRPTLTPSKPTADMTISLDVALASVVHATTIGIFTSSMANLRPSWSVIQPEPTLPISSPINTRLPVNCDAKSIYQSLLTNYLISNQRIPSQDACSGSKWRNSSLFTSLLRFVSAATATVEKAIVRPRSKISRFFAQLAKIYQFIDIKIKFCIFTCFVDRRSCARRWWLDYLWQNPTECAHLNCIWLTFHRVTVTIRSQFSICKGRIGWKTES